MNSINEILLIGQIISDPESVHDEPVGARFKLLTTETYFSKKNEEKITNSEIHNIKCWKQNAEFALNRLKKGDIVLVRGKLHYHIYTTDIDKKGKAPEIITTVLTKI